MVACGVLGRLLLAAVAVYPVAAVSNTIRDQTGQKRTWEEAQLLANNFAQAINMSEKARFVTGQLSLAPGSCIGNILPNERVGFGGICMQDGPAGINLADSVSVFGSGVTLGATWDRHLAAEQGKALGSEFLHKGIHVGLGPSSGPLGRHALGGRNFESPSVDPYLAGAVVAEVIRGQLGQGVQTCAKHIVGNEQETQRQYTTTNNDQSTRIEAISSNIDDRTLHELYMWPFGDALRAGTTSVMCSYNRLNGTHACENDHLLKDILRDEMGFRGYVMSDWYATHSGAASINAGLDLNMPGAYNEAEQVSGLSYWGVANITTMVDNGAVDESRLTEMVSRVMTPYYLLGQDLDEYPAVDPSMAYSFGASSHALAFLPKPYPEPVDVREDHHALIRRVGAESVVLLKNEGGVLPLDQPANLAVYGNDAADPTDGLVFYGPSEIGTLDVGAGAASVRHSYIVSPLEAIRARVRGYGGRVQYILDNDVLARNDFRTIYPPPETCLVFLNSFSGETRDRTSYEADWNSTVVVENVAAQCSQTVVVTHSVGINHLPWADHPNITAILAAHLPGQETGNAIADVLFGDINPSGHLPYTIPKEVLDLDIPIINLSKNEITGPDAWQADFEEGLLIDYRKLDANGVEPRYAFGFGLSYTTFELAGALDFVQAPGPLAARPEMRFVQGSSSQDAVHEIGALVRQLGKDAAPYVPDGGVKGERVHRHGCVVVHELETPAPCFGDEGARLPTRKQGCGWM